MAGMQLLFLSFTREHESESDRIGVEYATKIGYDAHQMAEFFKVLDKMSMDSQQGGVPTFLSTHPDPADRYEKVESMSNEWQAKYPGEKFQVNSDRYLQMIDGIVYGDDPRQGFVENHTFYHPELRFKFAFPDKWKLENKPTQVQIISPDQDAGIIFSLSSESTPEGPETFIGQFRKSERKWKRRTGCSFPTGKSKPEWAGANNKGSVVFHQKG